MIAGGHWRAHMIVYHGSNVAVPEPRLVAQNRFLDFGYGFYTTTNRAQAISFADKVTKRRGSGQRTVSVYALDEGEAFSACSLLRCDRPGEAWLDFVCANRSGKAPGQGGDFIFGPVANDDVYRTFTLYSAGLLTKEQTLEQLKVKRLYDQLVLTTEKACPTCASPARCPRRNFDGGRNVCGAYDAASASGRCAYL